MKKNSVILIGFLPIPRIYKRIEIEKKLFSLHLICWDRGSNMLSLPESDEFESHVVRISAGNNPIKRNGLYKAFSKKAMELLKSIQPELIHVQGLDMLKIAVEYKKKHNSNLKIVYEVADIHRLIADKPKNLFYSFVQKYLIKLDRKLSKDVDLLIVTSQKHIDSYFGRFMDRRKIMLIPNVPSLSAFKNYKKKNVGEPLVVGYIGSIRYKHQMKLLIEAADECNIKLMIAGFEVDSDEIKKLCESRNNIEWVGQFNYESQVAVLYGKCDLMYSVYDADMENVRVAIPNKLYESIYCEVPLIVAKNTYLADVVEEWGVGVAVDYHSSKELVAFINRVINEKSILCSYQEQCKKHKEKTNLEPYNEELNKRLLCVGDNL